MGWRICFLAASTINMGRHLDAVQALTRAGELQPTNAQARYNLGIVLEHLGAADQAQAAYQQAIALQPDYPLAQQGLERTKQAAPPAPTYTPAQPTAAYAPNTTPNYAAPASQTPAYQPEQTQAALPYTEQPTQQQPAYGQPNYAQPPAYGQQPPAYGQAMKSAHRSGGKPSAECATRVRPTADGVCASQRVRPRRVSGTTVVAAGHAVGSSQRRRVQSRTVVLRPLPNTGVAA